MNTAKAVTLVKAWLNEPCDTLGNGQTVRAITLQDEEAIWALVQATEATLPKPQVRYSCRDCGAVPL